jgi:hypothetical protein
MPTAPAPDRRALEDITGRDDNATTRAPLARRSAASRREQPEVADVVHRELRLEPARITR